MDEAVAKKIFDTAVQLTAKELLALSPALRKILNRKIRNQRVTPVKRKSVQIATLAEDGITEIPENNIPANISSYINMDSIRLEDDEMFEVLLEDRDNLKAGAVIQRDPVEAFKLDIPDNDDRKRIVIVAGKASGLRTLQTKINHNENMVEAILDSGSQIIVIDKTTAVELGLNWDPELTVHLQDVHGNLEETAGLARNVPFQFGNVTIYLQLHVQPSAPFDVLLGRPFDVLTESMVKNFKDGEQEITITDPNTGSKCTMGTQRRGPAKKVRFSDEKLVSEEKDTRSSTKEGNFQTSKI
jgi:hypothetical protein